MEERYYNEEEVTIDLKQLLLYVLKKWKVILLFVLIGAVIGAGFGLMKSGNGGGTAYDAEKASLYAAYEKAMEDYDEQAIHNAQSALSQMNPNAMYASVHTYLMTADSDAALSKMALRYETVLQDAELVQALAEECGLTEDLIAAGKMISASGKRYSTEETFTYQLAITAAAPTEESCSAVADILSAKLDPITKELNRLYGDTACELISIVQQYGYSANLVEAQKIAANELNYKRTLRDNAKALLTAEEITYYEGDPSPDQAASVPFSARLKTIVKWAVIVAVVFAFLGACFYCVVYLFNGTLKTADDLRSVYGLYIVSYLNPNPNGKKTLAERMLSGGEMPLNSFEYLYSAVDALGSDNTLLCGSADAPAIARTKQQLTEKFPALIPADRLATDDAAITAAKDAEGVLLVVQLWHTTMDDLRRELEIIRKLKKPIKGVIVLKA